MNELKLSKKFFSLMACLFVVAIGYGVLLPVLPYFIEKLAANTAYQGDISFHFGILTAIYPITLVFTAPFWGRISDRIGPRALIIFGLSGFVLMQVGIAFSSSLMMLYAARITGSLLSSFLVPVINAHIADITSEAQRTKALAWSGTAVSVGVIMGPGLSGYLIGSDLHIRLAKIHWLIERFSLPFLVLALLGASVMIITLLYLKNEKRKPIRQKSRKPMQLFPKGKWKSLKYLLIISLVLQVGITLFETVFALFIKDSAGFSVTFIGTSLLVCGLVMALFQPAVARWGTLIIKDPKKQMALGMLLAGMVLPAFAVIQVKWMILVLIGLFGLGSSLVVPNLLASISKKDPEASGWAFGMQSSFSGIGQMLGPLAGTALYTINAQIPFILAGALLLITSLVQWKSLLAISALKPTKPHGAA